VTDLGWATELALAIYRAIGNLGAPLIRWQIQRRLRRGKEHAERWSERLGFPSAARPDGPLVWLHGASVGEAMSSLILIRRLIADAPGLSVLVTTGTLTSAALMAERLPPGVTHQFLPVDTTVAVRRFLDHWRPDLVLWFESELWPVTLTETAQRGTPVILINGRLSQRSFRRWHQFPGLARALLSRFRLLLVQSEEDGARFAKLGAPAIRAVGNLKKAADKLPYDERQLADLKTNCADRPIWLAASTHPGEEAIIATLHDRLAVRHPSLLTVLVPRHPARGSAIAAELAADRVIRLRSRNDALPDQAGIYIADTLGELGLWYRLIDLVVIGGSLGETGGHNPLEPAQLGCAVLLGPDMRNFATIASELVAAGGAIQLAAIERLEAELDRLLGDASARRRIADAGLTYMAQEISVIDRVVAELEPYTGSLGA
jgi:3-deoxy-D-manno-octulosonic-acid transferase